MQLSYLKVGIIETNCYILQEGPSCVVVDPGDDPERIMEALGGRKPTLIVLTHYHWDHTGAVPTLVEATGVPVAAHRIDAPRVYDVNQSVRMPERLRKAHEKAALDGKQVDRILEEGDVIEVGQREFKVLHTPGHSAGSICLYCAQEKMLIAGDTLFAGGRFGRTDFADGSMDDMRRTLETKFVDIPDDVKVYPGHEVFSVMGKERAMNPYLV